MIQTLKQQWAKGYGVIRHKTTTQRWFERLLPTLNHTSAEQAYRLLIAADYLANAAMWLVTHQTYAKHLYLDGHALGSEDFKTNPQGHTGGSLNMAVAYVGYLLANALSGKTRAWLMGQGHCVSAIDSVNLLVNNLSLEQAQRYDLSEAGLTRFINDFYSYRLTTEGRPDSPLGSHVNIHTAGALLEGGYLGFAELHYPHMPLPGESLVAFLSDGAFEEQRGADWAAHWWRHHDCGLAIPILIYNKRRIDQRTLLTQYGGVHHLTRHLKNFSFAPKAFDGKDPTAFACMILEAEHTLSQASQSYPVALPYGIAVTEKGAGFYGAGTNAAHNLPLGAIPATDSLARQHFNRSARKLFVPIEAILDSRHQFNNHQQSQRLREKDHPMANRHVNALAPTTLPYSTAVQADPMQGIDACFLAYAKANPTLRVRIGNPDEALSNHLYQCVRHFKHRVTEVEIPETEAIDGQIITALNEETVVCACLGNKAGLNLVVTYEAFAPKMLGALRQELVWSEHLSAQQRPANWLSVPVVLTSHTYENGKNERSHQDTLMAEALLGESSHVARVLFVADYNTSIACLEACYQSHGCLFTLVVPKWRQCPVIFSKEQAQNLVKDGLFSIVPLTDNTKLILTATGAYQLQQSLMAAQRLQQHGFEVAVHYLLEPGRFRCARQPQEQQHQSPDCLRQQFYPAHCSARLFISHIKPEVMAGIVQPLATANTRFLGYINQGGTLDTQGMLFVNQQNWAHIVAKSMHLLEQAVTDVLSADEIAALSGALAPQGVLW